MSTTPSFDLLHEGLKRQLWRMGWKELKPLQVDSIRHILNTDGHAILSAGTAAGKTEAAFLPVLSRIADEPSGSIRVIYVGPLKALINDQFRRVEELCGYLDVPVHRWHGDVSAAAKAKLVKEPGGILLITPESLESLFVNRAHALQRLLGGLRFVVIDELHSFLDNERGLHLRSLLYRVNRVAQPHPRLIGLSATIGDPKIAVAYLDRDHPERVQLITGDPGESELKLKIHVYVDALLREENENDVDSECDEPAAHELQMGEDIVRHCKGRSNLIFANSRNDVEEFGELAKRAAERQSLPDQFLVHHGSLSADIRVDTETTMKESSDSGVPATTFCSSTLEMGIDIGNVTMVGQIGPPNSVASLKQRVGRSGRRAGVPRILRMYIRCRETSDQSDLFDRLHLDLIQSIAAAELLLEKWVEPAVAPQFDLSTLTQQVISVIAETGGLSAADVFQRLCAEGAFREVDATLFAKLLRQLGNEDVIEQTAEGLLILGLKGEQIRKDKGFYAVFMTGDAYTVLHDGQKIGSVESAVDAGQHMVLAGRRWKVVAVDTEQMVMFVVPSRGYRRTPFAGGGAGRHAKLMEMMRQVLASDREYAYLDRTGTQLLNQARDFARSSGATARRLIKLGDRRTAVMTWCGSTQQALIQAMLSHAGNESSDENAGIDLPASVPDARRMIESMVTRPPMVDDLADAFRGSHSRKYDHLLGAELRWRCNRPMSEEISTAISIVQGVT